jgi:hypothetical protein
MKMKLGTLIICLICSLPASNLWAQERTYGNYTSFVVLKGIAPLHMTEEYANEIFNKLDGGLSSWSNYPIDSLVDIRYTFSSQESGSSLRSPFKLISSRAYQAGDVRYVLKSGGFEFEGNLFMPDGSSSRPTKGIWFGPDQIQGTADDVYYNNLQADTLVNVMYSVGMGVTHSLGNHTIEEAIELWKPCLPEYQHIEYSLGPNSISATTIIDAPEPSTNYSTVRD